jgi:hypothetical protein
MEKEEKGERSSYFFFLLFFVDKHGEYFFFGLILTPMYVTYTLLRGSHRVNEKVEIMSRQSTTRYEMIVLFSPLSSTFSQSDVCDGIWQKCKRSADELRCAHIEPRGGAARVHEVRSKDFGPEVRKRHAFAKDVVWGFQAPISLGGDEIGGGVPRSRRPPQFRMRCIDVSRQSTTRYGFHITVGMWTSIDEASLCKKGGVFIDGRNMENEPTPVCVDPL